jgi:hypothetical protein
MMKVSELQGVDLDYWAAKAHGWKFAKDSLEIGNAVVGEGAPVIFRSSEGRIGVAAPHMRSPLWEPSSDWATGGPIIERERIYTEPIFGNADQLSHWDAGCYSRAGTPDHFAGEWAQGKGATALEAAMRAYVASKFGDEAPDAVGQQG